MKGFIKDEIPSRWDGNQMTHDEWLAIVKDLNKLIRKQMKAIYAIMDLHKDENGWCLICNYPYPCSTIQAIEKELA